MRFTLPTTVKSFYDYFKLNTTAEELMQSFGYEFAVERPQLPQAALADTPHRFLTEQIYFALTQVSLNSETARRELIVAPVLSEIARNYGVRLAIEYPLYVNAQLKGLLDYYLRGKDSLLIVEAKQADMTRGFLQLAAELVALDKVEEDSVETLYGAVSVGNIWQFAVLHRKDKKMVQDVQLYVVPDQLEVLMRVLVGILVGPDAPQAG